MTWYQTVQQVPYGSGDMYSVWFLGWPGGAPVGGGLIVSRLGCFALSFRQASVASSVLVGQSLF